MPATNPSVELSRRERQCLALAAQGKDDQAIGDRLHLSPETVHWYIKRLMQRLEVNTRIQAIIWALGNGQLTFDDVSPMGQAGFASRPAPRPSVDSSDERCNTTSHRANPKTP
jgi:DNA-binding CsgD family transcriptional regulator